MFLENLVLDAVDPQRAGRFWCAALGARVLADGPDGFEMRLPLADGASPEADDDAYLDLCIQPVPAPPAEPLRLHLDLLGGGRQSEVAERLRALGARDLDIGQGDVPWIVLADVEGNPFCVMEARDAYVATGPIAALPLDSADPARDRAFWQAITGWEPIGGVGGNALRHPSGTGPLLEICPEEAPKGPAKNRLHLDIRLEAEDDPDVVAAGIIARGGEEFDGGWGPLPWRTYRDPSGNEFCVLPAPRS
ncbi:VOC family protein [Brachybacterium sp. DNPG3]